MNARRLLLVCALLLGVTFAPARAAADPAGAPAPVPVAQEAPVEEALSASKIFLTLFKHLEPHALFGVWWGGEGGLSIVKGYPADAAGAPLHVDEYDHPVVFHSPAEFKEHYRAALGGGNGFLVYNINTSMWIAAALLVATFLWVARAARRAGTDVPHSRAHHLFESLVLYVRDDMVYAIMGEHHGRRLVPLFLTQFFFILFMNVLGLMYLGSVGGTATANLACTGGLAATTLIWLNFAGMREHGVLKHWKNFAPHGLPFFVLPLIVLIELASALVIKPAALTIRLFANLTAGHLVMLSLFGLVYLSGTLMAGVPAGASLLFAIAISCLELFVAFVQAYIFTYLSIIFIGASVHPEH